jgi:hypothetical protein
VITEAGEDLVWRGQGGHRGKYDDLVIARFNAPSTSVTSMNVTVKFDGVTELAYQLSVK